MGDYEVLGFESLRNALPCIVSGNLVIRKREKREKEKKVASILILACAILIRSEQRGDGGKNIPVVNRWNH
jgi:hypothetical protein